jgi:tetratricopeptide (TPR) repeat protein
MIDAVIGFYLSRPSRPYIVLVSPPIIILITVRSSSLNGFIISRKLFSVQEEALLIAREAIKIDPANPLAMQLLAISLHQKGKYEEALEQ